MTKSKAKSSQYFRADLDLLRSVASKGNFQLLSAMLVLSRFSNGIPKTPTEKPFSITFAGAKAISEHLHCRWETGKALQTELILDGYISKLPSTPQKRGKTYKINYHTLTASLPVALVDGLKGSDSAIKRISKSKLTEEEKLNSLICLLVFYKNLSMSDLGGFYGIFQQWEVKEKTSDEKTELVRLSAENTDCYQTHHSVIQECLNLPVFIQDKAPDFWRAIEHLKALGLIYECVVLLEEINHEQHKYLFTIRINDYHADNADCSYINIAQDSGIAFYGHKMFDEDFIEGDINNASQGEKVIRLILPFSDTGYQVMSVLRPRFRFSSPDIAKWQESEQENISEFLAVIDDFL